MAPPISPLHPVDPIPDPPPLFPPTFGLIGSHADWRSTWRHIVAGKFSNSPYSSLLFYEHGTGYAEFYDTDGQGGISFLQSHSNWRNSWTHIVSGIFYGTARTGLLFYDREAGFAAIYDTVDGNLVSVREYSGWRTSWTHITTVAIPGSPYSGVVLYDQAAGHGEIHSCNGSGELQLIMQSDGWRKSWTHVVGDSVAGGALLFYEGSTGYGEIYSLTDDDISNSSLGTPVGKQGLPPATDIIPGNFGWFDTGFLFYDRTSGSGTFVYSDFIYEDIIVSQETYPDLGTNWDIIVSGTFWVPDPEDLKFFNGFKSLLFYDRAKGSGEFYFHYPYDSIPVVPLEGYVSSGSVLPGETISFYVNSRVGSYTIKIYRQDQSADGMLMTTLENIQQFPQPFPVAQLAFRDGPAWPPVADFVIPQDWPSALYLARVETPSLIPAPVSAEGGISHRLAVMNGPRYTLVIPFVVRALVPGSQSKILLYIADTTYSAYNFWGGRGLYGMIGLSFLMFTSPGSGDSRLPRALRVSAKRPYLDFFGIERWQHWEVPLIRWLARQGIPVELCTATDLHKDQANHAGFLQNYRLLVSVGHDEYWSKEMRDNVESFTQAGGNVAFLSANVCWWQIRFDLEGEQQICYKDSTFDPYTQSHPDLVTVNWFDQPVNRPETSLTGVSYYGPITPAAVYRVIKPDHWAFAGLNFDVTSFFGLYKVLQTVVGPETDKFQDGALKSPSNFCSLAVIPPLSDPQNKDPKVSAGTMGTFTKGTGQVFTVGTMNWSLGLSQDGGWNEIDQITLNIFRNLG